MADSGRASWWRKPLRRGREHRLSPATFLGRAHELQCNLLEQKTRALDQAAPLAGWKLPDCFAILRRLLEARLKKHGSREYVQVLRLMETFDLSEVTHAIENALKLGTISFDAVRHLMLCRIERRPPRLDMENYPLLPLAQVHTMQAADYMSLLVEVCA